MMNLSPTVQVGTWSIAAGERPVLCEAPLLSVGSHGGRPGGTLPLVTSVGVHGNPEIGPQVGIVLLGNSE